MARHPIMNRRGARTLRIPDLTGGINTRDSLRTINDNQLTDSLNMWWHDGMLKTRPGTVNLAQVGTVGYDEHIEPHQTDIFIGGYRLFYYDISGARRSEEYDDITETFAETGFWLQGEEEVIQLPALGAHVSFVCQKDNTVFAFAGLEHKVYRLTFNTKSDIPEFTYAWEAVAEDEITAPLIVMNCKTNGSLAMTVGETISSGVMVDGYNLIGSAYRMIYTSVNKELLSETVTSHHMTYALLQDTYDEKYAGKKVIVKYTDANGRIHEHSVTLEGTPESGWVFENMPQEDGYIIGVFRRKLWFYSTDESGNRTTATTGLEDYVENNLEIVAPYICDNSYELENKVFGMTQCEWFGGASEGISGGTRLFLGGNTVDEDKSLVVWSGLNDPLYFSENAYFYVGDNSSPVTGFGKQSDMLVIFKSNETWGTRYTQNAEISARNLIDQSVVDYGASAVYFPLIQINPSIGCDCPKTVQLCRNRLVWACSNGDVWTLSGQNQFSERNIYRVSEMMSQKLKTETDLKNAFSADWEGHYLLFIGNRVYVMDYESYGYAYISSHTKVENAQTKIPWWFWELGSGGYKAIAVIPMLEKLLVVRYLEEPNGLVAETAFSIDLITDEATDDEGCPIPSSFNTKLFDFGIPSHKKNVLKVDLSLGNNGGEPIKVELITEHGTEEQEIVLEGETSDIRNAGYLNSKAIFPCIRGVKCFGVKLSCEGQMSADGMTFDYEILGGVR